MRKIYPFIAFFASILFTNHMFGQSSPAKYTLQFSSGNVILGENFEEIVSGSDELIPKADLHLGRAYRLIQFTRIPNDQEKIQLEKLGVYLAHYVRNYAWLAEFPQNLKAAQLANFPIRTIASLDSKHKLALPLFLENYPSYALEGPDHIRLEVHYFAGISEKTIQGILGPLGKALPSPGRNSAGIVLPIADISALAKVPFIYFIQPAAPSLQLEQEVNRQTHRSNFIAADYPSGLHFDGYGVTAAVSEGMVDTTQIDFHGRIDYSYHTGSGFSGHATGVCRRMGGSGNYNPLDRGMAFGANLMTVNGGIWNNPVIYNADSLRIANHSYGYGCSYGYNGASVTIDYQVRTSTAMMHVFSCGNIGKDSSCNYYGAPGWANITGAVKQSKNVIATGSVNKYDVRMGFSSKGPAYDGRIKPDMCAVGPGGTSHAAPGVAGVMTQLYQAYKFHNSGAEPESGLIKVILQNTADDLGNPGPDFQHGYGRINARRAYQTIAAGNHMTATIANGGSSNVNLTVPAGTKNLRIMLYWTDYEATSGAQAALVNDLDLLVTAPNSSTYQPWVLDTAHNQVALDQPATRGRDSLNNMEQVTIDNPVAGNYVVNVSGKLIPQGPQKYYIVYEFLQDEITLTHPSGGETWVPGETEIVHWDSYGASGTFDLEFSADSGMTWSTVATGLAATQRNYDFTIPDTISGHCLMRISRGAVTSTSQATFSIIKVPTNLDMLWSCGDSAMFTWDPVAGATGYEVSRLGDKYMDSTATVVNPFYMYTGLSTTSSEWFSVKALGILAAEGRRAIAYEKLPGDTGCIPFDAALEAVISPVPGYYPDCIANQPMPVTISIRNFGVSTLSGLTVNWQTGSGPIHTDVISSPITPASMLNYTFADSISFPNTGVYSVQFWLSYPGDTTNGNDAITHEIEVYGSGTVTPSYTQNFDQFTSCSTAWGCSGITCTLSQNWFNVPNNPGINRDSIDFRTHSGGTGTGGTGPSADHTSGNGNYLYLEGSGNGGSGCLNKEAQLHSPCFDLTGTNNPRVSFWYHMNGGGIGSIAVDALVDGRWEMDIMTPISGQQGNNWLEAIVDLTPFEDKLIFLRFRGSTGNGWASDLAIDDINLETSPNMNFSADFVNICPNDTVQFTDSSTYTNSWLWQISPAGYTFTGGTSASSPNPQVVFSNPGNYTITLIGSNAFSGDTLTKIAYISSGSANISLSSTALNATICQGDTTDFTANLPNATQYIWALNGIPIQTSLANTYSSSSLVDGDMVSVWATLVSGCNSDTASITLQVIDAPDATFNVDTAGCPVITFNWTGLGGTPNSFAWDFGDGSPGSNLQTVIHDYAPVGNGTYVISLVVENDCGSDTTIFTLPVNCPIAGIDNFQESGLAVYPNPSTGVLTLELTGKFELETMVSIIDLHGRELRVFQMKKHQGEIRQEIDLSELSGGIYLLKVSDKNQTQFRKIILSR